MLRRCASALGRLALAAARSEAPVGASAYFQPSCQEFVSLRGLQRRAFATNSHDIFNQHRDSPANNLSTQFDFTPDNYEHVAEILARFPANYKMSACIPLLDLAQKQNQGWLPLAAMNRVAEILECPPIRVYEVATFYTMFNRSPMGKFHVMVCATTPCMLCGAEAITAALKAHLGVSGYGQTTNDGWFTLGEMECMGSCVNAPMIAVADYTRGVEGFSYRYYEDLTPADAVRILQDLRAGKTPKAGSQYRRYAEPAGHAESERWVAGAGASVKRTLTFEASSGAPPGPFCRDLDAPPPPQDTAQGGGKAGGGPPPPPPPPPPASKAAAPKGA